MTRSITLGCALVALLAVAGCRREALYLPPVLPREHRPPLPPPDLSCEEAEPPIPETLVWKRADALATDLSTALALSPDTMCRELGVIPCVETERVALGGTDPIGTGLYVPPARPASRHPTRSVVWCSRRVRSASSST
jgi:hypothetical protein